jgi:hypothetical protein
LFYGNNLMTSSFELDDLEAAQGVPVSANLALRKLCTEYEKAAKSIL